MSYDAINDTTARLQKAELRLNEAQAEFNRLQAELVDLVQQRQSNPFISKLSVRQLQVYDGILRRRSNKEIATELNVSERTVKYHVAGILCKAGAQTRGDLIYVQEARTTTTVIPNPAIPALRPENLARAGGVPVLRQTPRVASPAAGVVRSVHGVHARGERTAMPGQLQPGRSRR